MVEEVSVKEEEILEKTETAEGDVFSLPKVSFPLDNKEGELVGIVDSDEREQVIAKLQEENVALLEQVARQQADFDNYRKRVMKEKVSMRDAILGDLAKKLLPLLDNLERALAGAEEENGLKEGVGMIYKQFLTLFKDEGIEIISCKGEAFCPYSHEAVMQVETEDFPPNTVVEELQKGYRLKEKVLRASMVKVAK